MNEQDKQEKHILDCMDNDKDIVFFFNRNLGVNENILYFLEIISNSKDNSKKIKYTQSMLSQLKTFFSWSYQVLIIRFYQSLNINDSINLVEKYNFFIEATIIEEKK
jgi:hypothetical protein